MSGEERRSILDELSPPFALDLPQGPLSRFVFSSPHSGRVYPRRFIAQSRLSPHILRKSEDSYVDELFSAVSRSGATLLAARFPRAYLDVNREPFELDPRLFDDALPDFANTRSIRVTSGLGTLARVVADGEPIYRTALRLSDAFERIACLYQPYHATLDRELARRRTVFGEAILIDCHSMPSATLAQDGDRPDIVVGDRFGASCNSALARCAVEALRGAGFEVSTNRPYAGGYITEHYGCPAHGTQALQIEINRELYMNERTYRRRRRFGDVRARLTDAMAGLIASVETAIERPIAAE